MKKLLLVAILLMVVSAASFAQATQTANITANVNATLTLAKLTDLAALTANQGQTVFFASNTAQAASFLLTGAALASTTVGVAFPATLSDVALNTMTFTGQIPRTNVVAGAATSTALAAITGGTATTSAGGQLWIYAGGGVTAAAAQPAGQYTGVITVTVSQP
jgi:hypothetical protein